MLFIGLMLKNKIIRIHILRFGTCWLFGFRRQFPRVKSKVTSSPPQSNRVMALRTDRLEIRCLTHKRAIRSRFCVLQMTRSRVIFYFMESLLNTFN